MRIRRKTKRRVKRVLLAIPLIAAGWFLYLMVRRPASAKPSSIRVEMEGVRIERGAYLFTAVAACDRCHSQRDFTRLHAPVVPGGRAVGRIIDDRGLPGLVVAPNLTPDRETGLGAWTDGEKIRAIREGISKDGRALYSLMPYFYYRRMADEDVASIVAFLNSLAPVRNPLPKTNLSFPAWVFVKGEPQPVVSAIPEPDPGGGAVYGEYLATLAACEDCHTPVRRGSKILPQLFAGGRLFDTPYGQVYSTNITQDANTGIGAWSYQRFEERMRQHRQFGGEAPPKAGGDRFTVMPWDAYAQLTDEDLEALFVYVKAIKPVSNFVEAHPGGAARQ
jgi:mono/diheme cytochrome c family protein